MMHVGFHVILRFFIDFLNLNDIIYFVDRSGESSLRFFFFFKILVKYYLFYFWKFNPIALSVQFRFSKQNAHPPTEISKNMIILNKFSFLNNN